MAHANYDDRLLAYLGLPVWAQMPFTTPDDPLLNELVERVTGLECVELARVQDNELFVRFVSNLDDAGAFGEVRRVRDQWAQENSGEVNTRLN